MSTVLALMTGLSAGLIVALIRMEHDRSSEIRTRQLDAVDEFFQSFFNARTAGLALWEELAAVHRRSVEESPLTPAEAHAWAFLEIRAPETAEERVMCERFVTAPLTAAEPALSALDTLIQSAELRAVRLTMLFGHGSPVPQLAQSMLTDLRTAQDALRRNAPARHWHDIQIFRSAGQNLGEFAKEVSRTIAARWWMTAWAYAKAAEQRIRSGARRSEQP